MQGSMNHASQACDNWFYHRYKKTEVMYHMTPGKPYTETTISVQDQILHYQLPRKHVVSGCTHQRTGLTRQL